MAECRSCGKEVIWAKVWVTGSPIPLDPEPVPDGNIVLRHKPYVEVLSTSQIGQAKKEKSPLYVSHFATCRDGDKWRRRRVGGKEGKVHD